MEEPETVLLYSRTDAGTGAGSNGTGSQPRLVGADIEAALVRLSALRTSNVLTTDAVVATAANLGVSERTIWRWLDNGHPARPAGAVWQPSAEDVDAYVRWKGNGAAAWRERCEDGAGLPGLRTFQRGLARVLSAADRAVITDGIAGRRRFQVYLRWEPEARNQLWETDHKQLDIEIRYPRCSTTTRPWLTTFVDGSSRAIMGWAIDQHPTSGTVLAALGEAIRVDARRGPFGGLPMVIRPDNGLEFVCAALHDSCAAAGIDLVPTRPYHPHHKGKVERLHRTIDTEFLADLPHYTGGPRDAAGKLWGSGLPVLGIHELVHRFDEWVLAYNTRRAHQGIGGQTPLQRWTEDATPLREIADQDLRWLLLGEEHRRVRKSGIRFHGHDYIAPELNGLVGEHVEVRFRPHDDTWIEVFTSGKHVCTAYPHAILTAEQRDAVLEGRRRDAQEQAQRQRRATRRARRRLAPVTKENALEYVTVISASEALADRQRWDDRELRRAARDDLLGIPTISADAPPLP